MADKIKKKYLRRSLMRGSLITNQVKIKLKSIIRENYFDLDVRIEGPLTILNLLSKTCLCYCLHTTVTTNINMYKFHFINSRLLTWRLE